MLWHVSVVQKNKLKRKKQITLWFTASRGAQACIFLSWFKALTNGVFWQKGI